MRKVWGEFFKQPIDPIPWHSAQEVQKQFKDWFFSSEWYEVYDFLEFIIQVDEFLYEKSGKLFLQCGDFGTRTVRWPFEIELFKHDCNLVLEKELSGYRFVGNEVGPITSKVEVAEIEQALETTGKYNLTGVNRHFESALEKLSDRKNPDYRNSIKESISAVESISIIIAKDPKVTLGQALKKIKDKIGLHAALERGFSAIYGYTSDEGGIRHAMIDETTCDFEDAKYMLVTCSAFVNYLIMKANKAGLIE